MTAILEVLQPGVGTTLQDAGRAGQRHHGLPLSGWLDAPLAQAANALVGNPAGAAVLELRGAGTVLRVQTAALRLALAGQLSAWRVAADGKRLPVLPWESTTLQPGELLQLGLSDSGCAYLALEGGLQVPAAFGSRSSYWRAGLGDVLGRPLRAGDTLATGGGPATDPRQRRSRTPWPQGNGPIRVLLGPQDDHFTEEALAQLLKQDWQATAAQDRMGLRLQGPALQHRSAQAADIVSDGVTPGAIQVPANGQPIVLLADGQTVGGYPKIATVVRADLPRLAHLRAGTTLRFAAVTAAQARQALAQQQQDWAQWVQGIAFFLPSGVLDEAALYTNNLISGMLAGHPEESTP